MSLPKYVEGAGDQQGFWSFQRQWIPGWKSEVNDTWVFTYEHETFALSVLQLPPTLAHLFASWLAIKLELVFCGKEKKKGLLLLDYQCCHLRTLQSAVAFLPKLDRTALVFEPRGLYFLMRDSSLQTTFTDNRFQLRPGNFLHTCCIFLCFLENKLNE